MTSAGTGVEPRLRHLQLRRREDGVPARRDEEARVLDQSTACTWVRARSTSRTPTRLARTARSSPAPASPARRCNRSATSTGGRKTYRSHALQQFERLSAWKQCDDCAFIPVCAGGCTVAAHNELGRHVHAQLPQAEFRGGRRRDGRWAVRALPGACSAPDRSLSGGVNEAQETRGHEENHDAAPLARGRGRRRLAISRLQRNHHTGRMR